MTAKELLFKLPDALDAEGARDLHAVIQYDVSTPMYHVIDDGKAEAFEGRADAPDLVVTISDDDLVALMGGRLQPAMAFMTGRIKMQGDVRLAQRLVELVDQDKLASLA